VTLSPSSLVLRTTAWPFVHSNTCPSILPWVHFLPPSEKSSQITLYRQYTQYFPPPHSVFFLDFSSRRDTSTSPFVIFIALPSISFFLGRIDSTPLGSSVLSLRDGSTSQPYTLFLSQLWFVVLVNLLSPKEGRLLPPSQRESLGLS